MSVQHGKCGEGVHQLQPQALRAGRSGAVRTHARRWMAQRLGAGAWQWRCADPFMLVSESQHQSEAGLVEQGLQNVDELGRKLGVWVLSQPWA